MSTLYNLFGTVYLIPEGVEDYYFYVSNCTSEERAQMIFAAKQEMKRRGIPHRPVTQPMQDYVDFMLGDDRHLETEDFKSKMQKLKEKAKEKFQKRREQDIKDKMQEHVGVILHELVHAMHNHPNYEWPWKSFDFVHQTAVMMEEAGEAVRAANNMREKGKWQELYSELVQTAAMCLRVMEQIKEYAICFDKKNSY